MGLCPLSIMFRVTVMTNTASSGKRSEGTAGCGVDGLERMEIMPLPGKQMRNSVGTREHTHRC